MPNLKLKTLRSEFRHTNRRFDKLVVTCESHFLRALQVTLKKASILNPTRVAVNHWSWRPRPTRDGK